MAARLSDQDGFREGLLTTQFGGRLYYRDYGGGGSQGLPLLCLPGLARNSRDYHALASRHRDAGRRVIVPDYRGRGLSEREKDWRRYAAPFDVADIRQLAAALGIERVVAIGTSYGGLLAMALGAAAPRLLAAVVVNDIGPAVATGGQGRILDYVGRPRSHTNWPAAAAYLRDLLPTLSLRGEEAWLDFARGTYREAADGRIEPDWDPAIVRVLSNSAAGVTDLWALFHALDALPMLVLRGGRSDVLSAETLARMAREHPRLEAVEVPGSGHAPTLGEPAAMAAVDAFVDAWR